MADKNNNNLGLNNRDPLIITGNSDILMKFSPKIFETYKKLALERNICSYEINACPISGVGENAYGFVMRVCLKAQCLTKQETENVDKFKTFTTILKISPKTPAFRTHGRIVDLYKREVFMYQDVFKEYENLMEERIFELKNFANGNCDSETIFNVSKSFDVVPELLYANLDLEDEFIICEDLTLSDYQQNLRTNMPTYDLVCEAFHSIAKMHAMSFILQYRKPQLFKRLITGMSDNLFITDMEPVTVEFGKKYIKRTRMMLEQEATKCSTKQIEALQKLENNFKEICLRCVDGTAVAPYAVICHGDFWNNNILYKYNDQEQAIAAKLIDFQICRYASPILDLVHYLYTCTERELRSQHFMEFMNIYHATLTKHIQYYGHSIDEIYPKTIFLQHLRDFGIYGFCMAAYSIPFFISNTSEIPDLEEVATAIEDISSTENSDVEGEEHEMGHGNENVNDVASKRLELLEEFDLLTERTLPIFKSRMCGIVNDLEKYHMIENYWQW